MTLYEKLEAVNDLESFLKFNQEFRKVIEADLEPYGSTNIDLLSVLECMEACIVDNNLSSDSKELPSNKWRFAAELLYMGHIYE